jgi:hypothetical protein
VLARALQLHAEMRRASLLPTALIAALAGCGAHGDADPDFDGGFIPSPPDAAPLASNIGPDGCPVIFGQDILPEYHVVFSPTEWAALEDEFLHRVEREAAGMDPNPYHPVAFTYQGNMIPGVLIRLHGQSSWLQAVALDASPKMQFVISFNDVNTKQRFYGVRKVELDMPRSDRSFLRQRLALSYLHDAGLTSLCANNARLVINGTYYGLYTNLERQDKEFLQRVFPGASDGDLWEGGRTIQTNKDTFSWDRLGAFWDVTDTDQMTQLIDLPGAIRVWASESMMPDGDGYYGSGHNYYLYDHPTRGFVWLSHDLDSSMDFRKNDIDPVFWSRDEQPPLHYLLVMNDPSWFEQWVVALAEARAAFDAPLLEARVDAWSAQIASSVAEDAMKPFTDADHVAAVAHLRGAMAQRAAYIDAWLACRRNGGADLDGDGADFCHDCDDTDAAAYPGAVETCNKLDDNCDGRLDDVAAPEICM